MIPPKRLTKFANLGNLTRPCRGTLYDDAYYGVKYAMREIKYEIFFSTEIVCRETSWLPPLRMTILLYGTLPACIMLSNKDYRDQLISNHKRRRHPIRWHLTKRQFRPKGWPHRENMWGPFRHQVQLERVFPTGHRMHPHPQIIIIKWLLLNIF